MYSFFSIPITEAFYNEYTLVVVIGSGQLFFNSITPSIGESGDRATR